MSVNSIWSRLVSQFGKCEFETWVAEELVTIASKANAKKKTYAELKDIANATLYINNKDGSDWDVLMSNARFRKVFYSLPIFKVIKQDKNEVWLRYVVA